MKEDCVFQSWFVVYNFKSSCTENNEANRLTGPSLSPDLSVYMTNMNYKMEVQVRDLLLRKYLNNCFYSGSGDFCMLELTDIDLGSSKNLCLDSGNLLGVCYYCLYKSEDASNLGDEIPPVCPDLLFVLFHANGNKEEAGFELFRPDLDDYCFKIYLRILRFLNSSNPDQGKFIMIQLMGQWFFYTMTYAQKCAAYFQERLSELIYAAIDCWKIEVVGDPTMVNYVQKFIDAVSFSHLLNVKTSDSCGSLKDIGKNQGQETQAPGSNNSEVYKSTEDCLGDLLDDTIRRTLDPANSSSQSSLLRILVKGQVEKSSCGKLIPRKVTIVVSNEEPPKFFQSQSFKEGVEMAAQLFTNSFSDEWASALNAVPRTPDAALVCRRVAENYKLKGIQEINTIKRLLQNAETDFYALYRTCNYLRECGNGDVLLRHLMNEDIHPDQQLKDSHMVLASLEQHLFR